HHLDGRARDCAGGCRPVPLADRRRFSACARRRPRRHVPRPARARPPAAQDLSALLPDRPAAARRPPDAALGPLSAATARQLPALQRSIFQTSGSWPLSWVHGSTVQRWPVFFSWIVAVKCGPPASSREIGVDTVWKRRRPRRSSTTRRLVVLAVVSMQSNC